MAHHLILLQLTLTLRLIERDGGLSILCHSCGFVCQQRVLKMFPWLSLLLGWGSLTMSYTGKFVYIFIYNINIYIYIYIIITLLNFSYH